MDSTPPRRSSRARWRDNRSRSGTRRRSTPALARYSPGRHFLRSPARTARPRTRCSRRSPNYRSSRCRRSTRLGSTCPRTGRHPPRADTSCTDFPARTKARCSHHRRSNSPRRTRLNSTRSPCCTSCCCCTATRWRPTARRGGRGASSWWGGSASGETDAGGCSWKQRPASPVVGALAVMLAVEAAHVPLAIPRLHLQARGRGAGRGPSPAAVGARREASWAVAGKPVLRQHLVGPAIEATAPVEVLRRRPRILGATAAAPQRHQQPQRDDEGSHGVKALGGRTTSRGSRKPSVNAGVRAEVKRCRDRRAATRGAPVVLSECTNSSPRELENVSNQHPAPSSTTKPTCATTTKPHGPRATRSIRCARASPNVDTSLFSTIPAGPCR